MWDIAVKLKAKESDDKLNALSNFGLKTKQNYTSSCENVRTFIILVRD